MKSLKDLKAYRVILVDTMNLAYRSYNGISFSYKGKPTGMQYGILRFYVDMRKKYPNADIRFLWEGRNSWRKKQYPTYKARRRTYTPDPLFGECLESVRQMLSCLHCSQHTLEEYEADDLAKYYAHYHSDLDKLLVSKDHDWTVLLNDFTDVLSGNVILTEEDLEKSLGHTVPKLTLYMILKGDKSDDISGIPGFRNKIAIEMCNDLSIESEDDIIPWLKEHGYDSWAEKVQKNWWIIERNINLIYLDPATINPDNIVVEQGVLNLECMQKRIKEWGFKSFEHYFNSELS